MISMCNLSNSNYFKLTAYENSVIQKSRKKTISFERREKSQKLFGLFEAQNITHKCKDIQYRIWKHGEIFAKIVPDNRPVILNIKKNDKLQRLWRNSLIQGVGCAFY